MMHQNRDLLTVLAIGVSLFASIAVTVFITVWGYG
jgi:hypothetical protein